METVPVLIRRSKHYLPTPMAAVTALFTCFSGSQSFKPANSDFQALKLPLSSLRTVSCLSPSFLYFPLPLFCQIFYIM